MHRATDWLAAHHPTALHSSWGGLQPAMAACEATVREVKQPVERLSATGFQRGRAVRLRAVSGELSAGSKSADKSRISKAGIISKED
jgi:hypothetical protein